MTGLAVFDTAIGHCGLAWGEAGLRSVLLPEADGSAAGLRTHLLRRCPDASDAVPRPDWVLQAIDGIRALLAGQPRDLCELPLDERGVPDFHRRVYALARQIPPGQTRTYGELAEALGGKGRARAVGQALGHNPFAPVVPCHRVLGADGRPGGFSAPGGALLKLRMLAIEGARPWGSEPLFDER